MCAYFKLTGCKPFTIRILGHEFVNTGWHCVYIGTCIQSGSQVLISLVVWLQLVGKINNKMMCGKLGISLCALYLHLETERLIAGCQITWLAAYWIFLCIHYFCLQLMCFRVFRFKGWLLFVAQAGKMTIFITGLGLELPGRTLETFYMFGITTHWTSISSYMCFAWIKLLKGGLWFLCSLEYLLWLSDLDLWECCSHLALLGERSVLWYLIRLTCATWGSLATALMCLAVDFIDSIFLVNYLTLLAGSLSKSVLESLMVLETNSSSFKKNQKISRCKILAVSGGYLARDTWACTALYHSSTEWLPSLKLVTRSNLALTSLVCGFAEIFKLGPYDIQAKIFRWQAPWHMLSHTNIFTPHYDCLAFLGIWQHGKVHSLICFHTSVSTSEIYGTSYCSQSSPSLVLQYMAYTWVA